jgi:hypothetical protein
VEYIETCDRYDLHNCTCKTFVGNISKYYISEFLCLLNDYAFGYKASNENLTEMVSGEGCGRKH